MAKKDGHEVAASFHNTFRFIDDTLSIDNPHWIAACSSSSRMADRIYPAELSLNDTTPSSSSAPVQFLGMNIASSTQHQHGFDVSVYDKRESFPFTVQRYPQVSSLIPPSIPYGVFIGQLHRGYRLCSTLDSFISFSTMVYQRLLFNGCSSIRLLRIFKQFSRRNAAKFISTSHSHSHSLWLSSLSSSPFSRPITPHIHQHQLNTLLPPHCSNSPANSIIFHALVFHTHLRTSHFILTHNR